ncbi:MAG: insulinase family protein, partial [Defluviitaleaceae bacterium]|nr:insulinase family protein [Defluviitaleaceae bacterium]
MEPITLSNGTLLVLYEMPHLRSAALGVWVKNGSRNESKATNGISHFIEHMLFKGTTNRTAFDIADEIDAVGGQINAYTSKEYTCYHTRTLDEHLETAFEVLSDMRFNSLFDDGEIKKERNVIAEEINMYEDLPDEQVHDILQSGLWGRNPLGYPILGTKKSISKIDSRLMKEYFSENYRPGNTILSVAGHFDRDVVLDYAERYFGGVHAVGERTKKQKTAAYTPGVICKEKDIEQVHLVLGFPSIAVGSDKSYTLAILNTALGGGMSSRLFQKIREEHGLAYSVYSYNTSYVDAGVFAVYAALNPDETQKLIRMVVSEIKAFSLDERQLARVKAQIKSNYVMGLESSSTVMSSIGKSQLLLGRVYTPDEIIGK